MTKAKLKTVGVLVAVFLLGGVSGGAIMRACVHRDLSEQLVVEPTDARRKLRLRAMVRRLDLSPEQRTEIEEILQRRREERRQIQKSIKPDLNAWQREVKQEIAAVLTPEQRAKYARYEKQRQERKKRKHRKRPRRQRQRHGQ